MAFAQRAEKEITSCFDDFTNSSWSFAHILRVQQDFTQRNADLVRRSQFLYTWAKSSSPQISTELIF